MSRLHLARTRSLWRAVGGDTHIISGEFGFTVTAAPAR